MLAFVGEANDGLCGRASLRTGIRLGVGGASTGTDVLGEVLRRFEGEDSMGEDLGRFQQFAMLRRRATASASTRSSMGDIVM
jgi:hypothetical protein